MPPIRTIDPNSLPKHFDSAEAERRIVDQWDTQGAYSYDPSRPRDETFVVDTPPPTVSGSLHVGHIFSYTHTDVIVRQRRMLGKNIFYPMGWDDNGLPTERRVQNFFHVRADVHVAYEKEMHLAPATAEVAKKPPRTVSRPNFIEACHQVTREDEQVFKALWRRIGLSVDWRQEYATIDDRSRALAQHSFVDLFRKGLVYSVTAPTMWDVDFQTAVAQAEVEDRNQPGAFHHIEFGVEESDQPSLQGSQRHSHDEESDQPSLQGSQRHSHDEESDQPSPQGSASPQTSHHASAKERFTIATTRPELLAACVGIAAHPQDARYRHLFGRRAVTPLYRVSVPIFASPLADPAKGSGILMVCTFGDATDVTWWREQKLPLRQILDRRGRLVPVVFGTPGWESRDPELAQRFYAEIVGKSVKAARTAVVSALRRDEAAALPGMGPPLTREPEPIERAVKFFEKGDQPLEYISSRQWFVRLLDKKDELVDAGAKVNWHPLHMGTRYRNWVENLQLDWCISRQRYFGVQFPIWYPLDEEGKPLHDRPILADLAQLPVDPTVSVPPGFDASQRDQPGGFTAETDVFDTWFTSSLTPQIATGWIRAPERHERLFPADIRPQSHEIIRTWAFYTIVKAMLHENVVPWKDVVVSGWILDPDRKKMSKSKGNVVTPMHLLDAYGADAVRYWAAAARLGTDTAFDEKVFKVGRRLVTKLYNAGKYVLSQGQGQGQGQGQTQGQSQSRTQSQSQSPTQSQSQSQTAESVEITEELDRAFVARLRTVVRVASEAFREFEFAASLDATERFFWSSFTDSYLELAKGRARGDGEFTQAARGSAVATLRLGLGVLLRLFAPVLPFITEEIWGWAFASETGAASIHRAPWPTVTELSGIAPPEGTDSLALAETALAAINRRKSEMGASVGRPVLTLTLGASPPVVREFDRIRSDLLLAARCHRLDLVEQDGAADEVRVLAMELEEGKSKEPGAEP